MASLTNRTQTLFSNPTLKPGTRRARIRMSLQDSGPSLSVVCVTGAVCQKFLSVLSDRDFPYRSIKMLASRRSAGKQMTFQGRSSPPGASTASTSRCSRPGVDKQGVRASAAVKGAVVVDNSSAFRMEENVPLVISEAMEGIKAGSGKGCLIANPNCSTIICLMAATPLHRLAKVLCMVVSKYQAASGAGAGAGAMEELELQTREVLEGKPPTCNIFNQQ